MVRTAGRAQLIEECGDTIGLPRHGAKHVEAYDIAGALPNAVERRLAVEPGHEMVLDEAVAALAFERLGYDRRGTLANPILGDRRADARQKPFAFAVALAVKGGD